MSDLVKSGDGERTHIESKLMRESLLDQKVVDATKTDDEISILPDVNVIALGGQSIIDRGKKVLFPVLDALVEARKNHKLIVGVGGRG